MDQQTYEQKIADEKTLAKHWLDIQVWKLAGWAGFDYDLRTREIRPLGDAEPIYQRVLRHKRPSV